MKVTSKQNGLLTSLSAKPIIAPWSNIDLVKLEQIKLVSGEMAFGADGRLHTSKIWTLTDAGRRYVDDRAKA